MNIRFDFEIFIGQEDFVIILVLGSIKRMRHFSPLETTTKRPVHKKLSTFHSAARYPAALFRGGIL
jgi:hypothetical protein